MAAAKAQAALAELDLTSKLKLGSNFVKTRAGQIGQNAEGL